METYLKRNELSNNIFNHCSNEIKKTFLLYDSANKG